MKSIDLGSSWLEPFRFTTYAEAVKSFTTDSETAKQLAVGQKVHVSILNSESERTIESIVVCESFVRVTLEPVSPTAAAPRV